MEENERLIYRTTTWLSGHKGSAVIISILSVILLIVLHFFTNYALLQIEAVGITNSNNIFIYMDSSVADGKMKKVGSPGLVLLPRNTKSIVVARDSYVKTRVNLQIPWYGIAEIKVSLQKDKNAEKIAYRSTTASTCGLYQPKSDTLAYYNCRNPNAGLFKYKAPNTGAWSLQKIASIDYPVDNPRAGKYLGLISTSSDNSSNGLIIGVNEQGNDITYNAPPVGMNDVAESRLHTDTSITNLTQARIYTDSGSTKNNRFVVVMRSGEMFIGTPTGGSNVSYHHIEAPDDYFSSYNQTQCSLNSDFVYCYRGPAVIGDTSPNFDFSKVTHSQIIIYSFADQSKKIINVSNNLYALNDLYLTDGGELFGKRFGDLLYFKNVGGTYDAIELSKNVSAAAASDKLYYVNNNGIYTIDDNDTNIAYQVFYSPNVLPKSVYPVDGKVFIIGTTPFDPTTTYAYKLTSEENVLPGNRLIDLFPSKSNIPEMISNDLVGDRLSVKLNVPMRRTAGPSEISAIKKIVVENLQFNNPNRINFDY